MFLNKSLLSLGIITLLLPLSLPLSSITATKQEEYPSPTHNLLAAANQKRVALVIGNSRYKTASTLRNPVNDANDMTKVLRELGFEVITVLDANQEEMETALEEFDKKLERGGIGVFYYAGHGIQVNGENYLIPVDAKLRIEKSVKREALSLGEILDFMEDARTNLNIIILDACRDDPWSRTWKRSTGERGLAVVSTEDPIDSDPISFYIAFATAPGKTAADGDGRNGIFTSHLLQHIKTPNLSLAELFNRVGRAVGKETKGKQYPWNSNTPYDEFSFNPVSETVATQTPQPKPKVSPSPTTNLISYAPGKITLERTLTGHSNWVGSIAISPDGKTLVSGSDNTIKIWNLATGQLIRTLIGHFNWVGSIAISPDGKTLVSGSGDDKTIKISNLATGQLVRTLTSHSLVLSVAISPDGKTLVSGSYDKTIKIWNLATGELIRTLTGHSDSVRSVAISPDGQTLASGGDDNTIKIWNLVTGKLIRTLKGHSDWVESVAISPDGKTLVSGSDDSIKIWNITTGQLIRTLTERSDSVSSVAVSPDGKTLVSGSYENTIKIRNLATGKLMRTINVDSKVFSIAISPDGNKIISGESKGKIDIWQVSR